MRTAGVPGRGLLPINVHRGISLCLFVHALAHQPVFRGNEYDASFAKTRLFHVATLVQLMSTLTAADWLRVFTCALGAHWLDAAYCYIRCSAVCLSVCLHVLVSLISLAKTDEPIEMTIAV